MNLVLCNNLLYMHINFIIDTKTILLLKPYQIIKGEITYFVKTATNPMLCYEIRNFHLHLRKEKYAHFHSYYDLFYWISKKCNKIV